MHHILNLKSPNYSKLTYNRSILDPVPPTIHQKSYLAWILDIVTMQFCLIFKEYKKDLMFNWHYYYYYNFRLSHKFSRPSWPMTITAHERCGECFGDLYSTPSTRFHQNLSTQPCSLSSSEWCIAHFVPKTDFTYFNDLYFLHSKYLIIFYAFQSR